MTQVKMRFMQDHTLTNQNYPHTKIDSSRKKNSAMEHVKINYKHYSEQRIEEKKEEKKN